MYNILLKSIIKIAVPIYIYKNIISKLIRTYMTVAILYMNLGGARKIQFTIALFLLQKWLLNALQNTNKTPLSWLFAFKFSVDNCHPFIIYYFYILVLCLQENKLFAGIGESERPKIYYTKHSENQLYPFLKKKNYIWFQKNKIWLH